MPSIRLYGLRRVWVKWFYMPQPIWKCSVKKYIQYDSVAKRIMLSVPHTLYSPHNPSPLFYVGRHMCLRISVEQVGCVASATDIEPVARSEPHMPFLSTSCYCHLICINSPWCIHITCLMALDVMKTCKKQHRININNIKTANIKRYLKGT